MGETLQMGPVTLSVADLARSIAFYEETIGLGVVSAERGNARLGIDETTLLRLVERTGAREAPGTPGLFHFALVVPSRRDLARTLNHFVEQRTPLQGVADHLVSEALYLGDPDGHGIEIYRDRPREDWPRDEQRIRMSTLPLDVEGILETLGGRRESYALAAGTRMGHVHLRVSEVEQTESFFNDVMGLETMATMRGAVFLAADGYHHHIGANVWQSRGQRPRGDDSLGLERVEILVRSPAERDLIAERARERRLPVEDRDGTLSLTGVDGIVFTVAPEPLPA